MAADRRLRHAQHPAGRARASRCGTEPALARRGRGRPALAARHGRPAGARRWSPARVGARAAPPAACCPATAGCRCSPRVGTAGFFLLLTVKWVVPACLFGVLALAATLRWLWQTDRPRSPSGRGRDRSLRAGRRAGAALACVVGDGDPGRRRPDDLRVAAVRAPARVDARRRLPAARRGAAARCRPVAGACTVRARFAGGRIRRAHPIEHSGNGVGVAARIAPAREFGHRHRDRRDRGRHARAADGAAAGRAANRSATRGARASPPSSPGRCSTPSCSR